MNILYVITALGVGGAENLLADVCEEMVKRHRITVVYLREPVDYLPKIESLGVKTVFINLDKLKVYKTFYQLRRIIKQENINIVHTHLPAADTLGRLAALTCGGVSVVSTIHNCDLWKLWNTPGSLFLRMYNRFTVNRFKRSHLIAVSQSVKDFCRKQEGVKDDKITVIYNFINFENSNKSRPGFVSPLPDGCFSILAVARMEPNKGLMLLLKAARLLIRQGRIPNLRVMLLGQGSEEKQLYDFARTEKISENILFIGAQPNVYDYLHIADLMVLPSQNEGQSIAILEAFYCGTPVLASDIPANNEQLCGGANGSLFPLSGGEEALADAIQAFYEGGQGDEETKSRAKAYCLSRSKQKHIEALEGLYHALTGQDGG